MLAKRKADAISNDTTNIHVPLQNDVLIKLKEWDIGLYNMSTNTSIAANADDNISIDEEEEDMYDDNISSNEEEDVDVEDIYKTKSPSKLKVHRRKSARRKKAFMKAKEKAEQIIIENVLYIFIYICNICVSVSFYVFLH
jgi:hypothetical protein